MNELEARRSMAMKVMDVEYLPAISQEALEITNCKKYPLAKLLTLGVAFEPLVSSIQHFVNGGARTSGLYYVNTKGLQMAQFKNGSGFLGSLMTEAGTVGGGQAVMTPLACNPTMLFMAAALMTMEKKLDAIQALQQDIMDFLKAKEKAKVRGDINVLMDILNNYKFNWDNEKYKTNKHILVQDIRKEAEQSLLLCCDQIQRQYLKKEFIHRDEDVMAEIQKLQNEFQNYKQALYLYSFSSFLEVMLLENFNSHYLDSVSQGMEKYASHYRELYTACYNQLEELSKSSVQSFLANGLAGLSKGVGGLIAQIPVVSDDPVDEALVSLGSGLDRVTAQKTKKALEQFAESAENCSAPFIENINEVNRIYNQPTEVLFDAENVYFLTA